MSIGLATITNSIAALSVSGVTIKDVDKIPSGLTPRDCPCLFPKPDGFISDFEMTADSFNGKKSVRYTLNYTFAYSQIGMGRSLLDVYDDMLDKLALILDAALAVDIVTGAAHFGASNVTNVGPVTDPAGTAFHGAIVSFDILEFVG